MSSSFSTTESSSFTNTHARHIAAKVATDLKRMQAFYGYPSDDSIDRYEMELAVLMRYGCIEAVCYGFKRGNVWVEPTLRYSGRDLAGASLADDDPGRIRPGLDISGATFGSFLTYSGAWDRLPAETRLRIEKELPFQRGTGNEPTVSGYFSDDRSYSAGGRALQRASLRSFG